MNQNIELIKLKCIHVIPFNLISAMQYSTRMLEGEGMQLDTAMDTTWTVNWLKEQSIQVFAENINWCHDVNQPELRGKNKILAAM